MRNVQRHTPTPRDLRHAARACYVAGALMLVSGTVGSTTMVRLGHEILSQWLPVLAGLFTVVLAVALIIAALGGIAVLAGGWALHKGNRTLGTLLITLGVGSGIVGLAFHLAFTTFEGNDPVWALVTTGSSLSGIALLLTIYARWKVSTLRWG